MVTSQPPPSALQSYIEAAFDPSSPQSYPEHLQHLAAQIAHNLIHEHHWTEVEIHKSAPLPRPMITGLPPRRLYTHPDEQTALLASADGVAKDPAPEREWVLPSALREEWSLRRLAEVFDAIGSTPPGDEGTRNPWRTTKRVVLATLDDDSTVAYYIVHDGIVKPRQN